MFSLCLCIQNILFTCPDVPHTAASDEDVHFTVEYDSELLIMEFTNSPRPQPPDEAGLMGCQSGFLKDQLQHCLGSSICKDGTRCPGELDKLGLNLQHAIFSLP